MSTGSVDFSRPSFKTPAMDLPLGSGARADVAGLFQNVASSVGAVPAARNLPSFRESWEGLPEEEKRAVLAEHGYENDVRRLVLNDVGSDKLFEDMTPLESSRALGFEPGGHEELAWIRRVKAVRESEDTQLQVSMRADWMRGVHNRFGTITDDVLAAARTGKSLGALQNAAQGYNSFFDRAPRIVAETLVNQVVQDGAVGLAGMALQGVAAADRAVNAAVQLLPEAIRPAPNTAVSDLALKAVKDLNEMEPLLQPIARESMADDILSGVAQAAGYLALGAVTGGASTAGSSAALLGRTTAAAAARATLTRGALAAFGSPSVTNAALLGLSARQAMRDTETIADPNTRLMVSGLEMLLLHGTERLQFGRNVKLSNAPLANFGASLFTEALAGNASEEFVQWSVSDAAQDVAARLTGVSRDSDTYGGIYEAMVGGGTGVAMGLLGVGNAYRRSRATKTLLQAVNDIEVPAAAFVNDNDVPDDMKQRAFRQALGKVADVPVFLSASDVVSMGEDAVKTFSQVTGHRESTVRAAARRGDDIQTDLGNGMYASSLIGRSLFQDAEGKPQASTATPASKSVLEAVLNPGTSRADRARALLSLRAARAGKPAGEVSASDAAALEELLDIADGIDDTERVRKAVEAGTATEQEREQWRIYNEERGVQEPGRPAGEDAGQEADAPVAAGEDTKRQLTGSEASKRKYLVNAKAQALFYQRAKEFITGSRRKSLHDFFRAAPEAHSVQELRFTAENLEDMAVEMGMAEQVSALDNVKSLRDLRASLIASTNGDTEYVSRVMHLLKSFISMQARVKGVAPETMASSFYVNTILKSPAMRHIREQATAPVQQMEDIADRGYVKALKSTGAAIDNALAPGLLAARTDTADALIAPDGARVGLAWGPEGSGRLLQGIQNTAGAEGVAAIPDLVATGTMREFDRGRSRVYSDGRRNLTLRKFGGTWYPTAMSDVVPLPDPATASPTVAAYMKRSLLQGSAREALQGLLQTVEARGDTLGDLADYENAVTRSQGVAAAIDGFADSLVTATRGFEKIDPALMTGIGIPLPEGATPEFLAEQFRSYIGELRSFAHDLRNFFLDKEMSRIVNEMTTRGQILQPGNRNVDGVPYARWLAAVQAGDYAPMAEQTRRADDGTERRAFSTFEDFSRPYDKARLTEAIRQYLNVAFDYDSTGIDSRRPTAGRRKIINDAVKRMVDTAGLAEYIAGFAEYAGFVTNTDPRVYCDLHINILKDAGKAQLGVYSPAEHAISVARGVVGNAVVHYLTAADDAGRKAASAELGSTLVHEFHHQLMYTLLTYSYVTETEVGPLYADITESAGVPPSEISPQNIGMFTDPSVDSPRKYVQYLSYPAEQLAYLAERLFSDSLDVPYSADLANVLAEYGQIDTRIFGSEAIALDLQKIQALFVAASQPELLALLAGNTRYQRELASISTVIPRVYAIFLNGGAFNYSSIPHEFFHLFVSLLRTDNPGMYNELLRVSGEKPGARLSIDAEERLARQFEMYLLGGKAPALHLRETFDKFSGWISTVYDEEFRGNNAVPWETKRLFDKFFATEQQIRLTEAMAGIESTYLKMLAEDNPRKKAVARAEKRVHLTARERERKLIVGTYMRLSGEFRELRAQARQNVGLDPLNTVVNEAAAAGLISKGKLYGFDGADPVTPGREADLVDMVGEWNAANPENTFGSVGEMLDAARRRGSQTEQQRAEFNRLRDARYAQVLTDLGGMQDGATKAVYSEEMTVYMNKLAEAVALERARKAGAGVMASLANDSVMRLADTEFNGHSVREARNYRNYVGVMRKNLKAFGDAMAKGDIVNASLFLDRARMAERKVQSAVELRDKVSAMRQHWQRGLVKRMARLPLSYRDNIAAVLNRFGFNKRAKTLSGEIPPTLSLPALTDDEGRGAGMNDIAGDLARMLPDMVKNLAAPEGLRSYEDLTVEQFNQVFDALRLLERSGSSEYRALKQLQYAKVEDLINDSVDSMEKLKTRPEDYRNGELRDVGKRALDRLSLHSTLTEYIFQRADGYLALRKGAGAGPLTDLFYASQRATHEAEDLAELYASKMKPLLDAWKALMKGFKSDEWGPVPEAMLKHNQKRWTPNSILMFAMNTGNAYTLNALKEGYDLTDADVERVMRKLGPEGGRIVQGIGDILGSLYDPQVKVFERIAGRTPEKVTPLAVDYGTYKVKGWYLPHVPDVGAPSGSMYMQNLFPAIGREPSQMHERTGSTSPPVLDVSVLYNHVYSASRLIAAGDAFDVARRVLFDDRWSKMFRSRFGNDRYRDVLEHFDTMANPHILYRRNNSALGPVLDWLRQSAVTASLGLRLMSGVKQWSDIVPAVNVMAQQNRAGTRRTIKAVLSAIRSLGVRGAFGLYQMPTVGESGQILLGGVPVDPSTLSPAQMVYAKSAIMRGRDRRIDQSLRHIARNAVGGQKTFKMFGLDFGWQDVQEMLFSFIRIFDRGVSSSVWLAQYRLAMAGEGTFEIDPGMSMEERERRAVQDADAVAKTMSSGAIADQTASQRDPLMRLFTTFMSSQVRRGSRMATLVDARRQGRIDNAQLATQMGMEIYGRIVTGSLMYGIGVGLRNAVFGAPEDEEEEGWWDYGYTVLTEPLWGTLDTIPMVANVSGWGRGYSHSVLATPSQKALDTAVGDLGKAKKAYKDGDYALALLYTAYGAGYVAHVPVRNVTKQVEDAIDFISPPEE